MPFCPNCTIEVAGEINCKKCGFDFNILKEHYTEAFILYNKALYFYNNANFTQSIMLFNEALLSYPFDKTLTLSAFLVFIDLGRLDEAKELLKVLKYLKLEDYENYYELLNKHIGYYNCIVEISNNILTDNTLEIDLLKRTDLSYYETQLIKLILQIKGKRNAVKKNKFIVNRLYEKVFIALSFMGVLFLAIIYFNYLNQDNKEILNTKIETSEKKSYKDNQWIFNLVEKLNNLDYDIFDELSLIKVYDVNRFNRLSKIRYHSSQRYYREGLKNYKLGNLNKANIYFEKSYNLDSVSWFAEHNLYYWGRTKYKLGDSSYILKFTQFLETYDNSIYVDDVLIVLTANLNNSIYNIIKPKISSNLIKSPYYSLIAQRIRSYEQYK